MAKPSDELNADHERLRHDLRQLVDQSSVREVLWCLAEIAEARNSPSDGDSRDSRIIARAWDRAAVVCGKACQEVDV